MLAGKHYNDAVDRWSLGVLLYEFLVGVAPFLAPERDVSAWASFNRLFFKSLSDCRIEESVIFQVAG